MPSKLKNEDIVEIAATNLTQLKSVIEIMGGYSSVKQQDNLLQLNFPAGTAKLEDINRYCFEKGITLNLLMLKKKSLEAKFFELTNN